MSKALYEHDVRGGLLTPVAYKNRKVYEGDGRFSGSTDL